MVDILHLRAYDERSAYLQNETYYDVGWGDPTPPLVQ